VYLGKGRKNETLRQDRFRNIGGPIADFRHPVLSPRAVYAVVATIIRDQDNPARHPFTTNCGGSSNTNTAGGASPLTPAGEEVVIETISINGYADPGNKTVIPFVATTASGVSTQYFLNVLSDAGINQPDYAGFSAVQPLRLYADPGIQIHCGGFTANANPTGGLGIFFEISGYYVALP
jgi:hypothetical protein